MPAGGTIIVVRASRLPPSTSPFVVRASGLRSAPISPSVDTVSAATVTRNPRRRNARATSCAVPPKARLARAGADSKNPASRAASGRLRTRHRADSVRHVQHPTDAPSSSNSASYHHEW